MHVLQFERCYESFVRLHAQVVDPSECVSSIPGKQVTVHHLPQGSVDL